MSDGGDSDGAFDGFHANAAYEFDLFGDDYESSLDPVDQRFDDRSLDRPIADPGLIHVGDAIDVMLTTILGQPPVASGHAWLVAQMSSMM